MRQSIGGFFSTMKALIATHTQSNDWNLESICETLKQYIPEVKVHYGVKTLGVFSSFVREEATTSSDLDLLVEFEEVPTFRKYMDLKFFLEDLFNRPVDLVIEDDIKPLIRQQILREVVYVS